MKPLSRRTAIRVLAAAAGGLAGAGLAGGYALRDLLGTSRARVPAAGDPAGPGTHGSTMGDVTRADMTTYMDLFNRHTQLRRTVELIPGGVRTVTEADDPDLATQLQAHVASMYAHLNQGAGVSCMSSSVLVLFGNSRTYRRSLTNTARGVAVVETSDDPRISAAIRSHAAEVTGFVDHGMPAMMPGMMGGQGMTG
jgi:hypothetical protein